MNVSFRKGFTLVELLIVIVVIGILATIAVVAYNGAQNRAYAAAATSVRSSYARMLKLYKADKGRYPIVAADGQTVCLGSASDYVAKSGFAANQCRYSDYSTATASLDTAISTELRAYASLPAVNWPSATETYSGTGVDYYRGIFYYSGTLANQGRTAWLWFYLPGQHTCPTDGYGSYDPSTGATQCTISFT